MYVLHTHTLTSTYMVEQKGSSFGGSVCRGNGGWESCDERRPNEGPCNKFFGNAAMSIRLAECMCVSASVRPCICTMH